MRRLTTNAARSIPLAASSKGSPPIQSAVSSVLKLFEQISFPGPALVHLDIKDASEVSWDLHISLDECADVCPTEPTGKPEHLADDILLSSRMQMVNI